jgi:hypothetical protein
MTIRPYYQENIVMRQYCNFEFQNSNSICGALLTDNEELFCRQHQPEHDIDCSCPDCDFSVLVDILDESVEEF